ncbi:MAG: hypothetical protein II998_08930 [Clostridia bacterium]|nr:hypothetical protein [Clostridia bacterium]
MKDLTKGNIYKTFILFAIPLVLSGVLSQAYAIIDSIIAGKWLGASGIASTGATASLIQFISSVFWGYSAGFSIYIAVLFGSQNYERLKTTLYSNFIVVSLSCIAVSAIMVFFRDSIFTFLEIDNSIKKDAEIYFVTYTCGLLPILLNNFFAVSLHAMGISGFSFKMAIVSSILNITGNILSVTQLHMGIFGIALSSVTASLIVDIFYIVKIKGCFSKMPGEKDFKLHFSMLSIKRSVSYAIPVTIQQMIMYAASFLIAPMVNALGGGITAAYSVVHRIYEINANVYQNSAKTLTNYTAQCVGAKKSDQIQKGIKVAFLQGAVLVLPFILICVVFAAPVCKAFFPSEYVGEGLKFSIAFSKFYLPFILFNVVNNLFHAFYRGVKNMKMLLITTTFGSIVRVVASAVLVGKYGIHGIYAGWVISWIAEAILCIVSYYLSARKNNILNGQD